MCVCVCVHIYFKIRPLKYTLFQTIDYRGNFTINIPVTFLISIYLHVQLHETFSKTMPLML